mmetsp:Transcript_120804/g.352872  ORF Transcript_120804/g.352872 Transcript_120804/m.352872 type:complete len:319 (-) Transcript_120804:57-1013(-)
MVVPLRHQQHLVGARVYEEAHRHRLRPPHPHAAGDHPEGTLPGEAAAAGVEALRGHPDHAAGRHGGLGHLANQHVALLRSTTEQPGEGWRGRGGSGWRDGEERALARLLDPLVERGAHVRDAAPAEAADAVPVAARRQCRVFHDDEGLVGDLQRAELEGVSRRVARHRPAAVGDAHGLRPLVAPPGRYQLWLEGGGGVGVEVPVVVAAGAAPGRHPEVGAARVQEAGQGLGRGAQGDRRDLGVEPVHLHTTGLRRLSRPEVAKHRGIQQRQMLGAEDLRQLHMWQRYSPLPHARSQQHWYPGQRQGPRLRPSRLHRGT